MNRLGLAVAAIALAGLGACGGSDETKGGTPTGESHSLDLLSAGQACAQVQLVNDELDGPGDWPIPTYGDFGSKTAPLADQSVPEIADALRSMSGQASAVGEMSGDDTDAVSVAAAEWATEYQAVADICARTDSPIGRLP